ncbi:MAG: hypothetical protein AAFQ57_11515 [Cyanobacteria bacterium J06626_14]
MKQQISLPILTVAILLAGIGAYKPVSAQPSHVETFASTYDPTRERPFDVYSIDDLFEGVAIAPEQQTLVLDTREWFERSLIDAWNEAYQEDRELTDADLQGIEDEYYARLGQVLSATQIEQLEENEVLIGETMGWKTSPRTVAEWQHEDFESRFADIELTPEQVQFVRSEIAYSYEANDELIKRLSEEGLEITDADLQALEDTFFTRLEQTLSPEQIQQVRENDERIAIEQVAAWEPSPEVIAEWLQITFEYRFENVELTPEQETLVRAELARDLEARLDLTDPTNDLTEADIEASFLRLDNEFFTRLEQALSPEQIQQVRENDARLISEAAQWEATPEQLAAADFEIWFTGIELTPEQETSVHTELTRYHEARYKLMDDVDQVLAEGGDPEAEFQSLDNELVASFEQMLSPEQIKQLQDNYPYLFE